MDKFDVGEVYFKDDNEEICIKISNESSGVCIFNNERTLVSLNFKSTSLLSLLYQNNVKDALSRKFMIKVKLLVDVNDIDILVGDEWIDNILIEKHNNYFGDAVKVNNMHITASSVNVKNIRIESIINNCTLDNQELIIKECIVNKLYANGYHRTKEKYYKNSVRVYNSEIVLLMVIMSHYIVEIKNCKIGEVRLSDLVIGSLFSDTQSYDAVDYLCFTGNDNSVETLTSDINIGTVEISRGKFDLIKFYDKKKWGYVKVKIVSFNDCLYCDKDNFEDMTEFTWELVIASAKALRDDNAINEAYYQYELIRSKKRPCISRWFLHKTTGFGYKPSYAIWFTLKAVGAFGILYTIFDLIEYNSRGWVLDFSIEGFNMLGTILIERLYYSAITFTTTGYGEVGLVTNSIRAFSFFEACLGVAVLSMFVYSLTKTHLK